MQKFDEDHQMNMHPPNEPKADLPNRGTLLCVFSDNDSVDSYETALSGRGFTLLRARHAMHGYWLSVTAQPDVIVTDVIKPNDESNYFLDCLTRNTKTSHIPVVALLDQVEQMQPSASCLQAVTSCFLKGVTSEELIAELDRLVSTKPRPQPQAPADYISRFDAFFADLGHATPKAHWSTHARSRSRSSGSTLTESKVGNRSFDQSHQKSRRSARTVRHAANPDADRAQRLAGRSERPRD